MKVLFVCQENTCRSQMAEGFGRNAGIVCESAGVSSGSSVNPSAVSVMEEIGIDISNQESKSLESVDVESFDIVISMCSVDAKSICPSNTNFENAINWNVMDPKGHELAIYQQVRDLIKSKLNEFIKEKEHKAV